MRAYKAEKPCPCCGKSASESPRTSVNEVCWKCRDIYHAGKKAIAQAESDGIGYANLHFYPEYVFGNETIKAFVAFINEMSSQNAITKGDDIYIGTHNRDGVRYVKIKRDLAEKFKQLYLLIIEDIKERERRSFADGSSVLMRLHDGSLSMNDFNERLKR